MSRRKISKLKKIGILFVISFVLGFGFLSGFWINLGFNPKEEILDFFVKIIENLFPNPLLSFFFWFIPLVATLFSVYLAYKKGGFIGLVAVALAFSAGLAMPTISAFMLLGIAIILGFTSPFIKRKILF